MEIYLIIGIITALTLLGFLIFIVKRNIYVNKIYTFIENQIKQKIIQNRLFNETEVLIKNLKELSWIEYKAQEYEKLSVIKSNISSLQSSCDNLKSKVYLSAKEKLFGYYYCEEDKLKKYLQLKIVDKEYQSKIISLEATVPNKDLSRLKKMNYYNENSKQIRNLRNVLDRILISLSNYQNVIKEIKEAQDSISSAQTMETLDLFSKNKGISVMSSMSTSSANSEIKDIKPALDQLKNSLDNINMKEVCNAPMEVDDTFDLLVDFIFDPGFDFFSIVNLSALSSADSNLDELAKEIRPIGDKLKESKLRAKKVIEEELSKLP